MNNIWRGRCLGHALALAMVCGMAGQGFAQTAPSSPPSTAPLQAASASSGAPGARPALIPAEVFAERPFMSRPRLSPDGMHIAARMNVHGVENLAILSVQNAAPILIPIGQKKTDPDLRWYRWAGDNTLLISVGKLVPWDGDEALLTRLIAYDIVTKKMLILGSSTEGLTGDDVLWVDPEGKSALMAYQATIYEYPSIYRVDIATNKRKLVQAAEDRVWDWYADNTGVVRVGYRMKDGGKWDMLYRAKDGDPFRTVVRAKSLEDEDAQMSAVHLWSGTDLGYRILKNEKTGRDALYRYDFAKREKGELVYENAKNDIEDFDLSEDKGELISVSYTDDKLRTHWFDKELAELQDSLDKSVGNRQAWVVTKNRDRSMMIVHVGSASDLGSYYLYQVSDGVMHRLAFVNEKLPSASLATPRYVSYKARDGLEIPAYLTLPLGRDPKNLPLIILPHGGPYGVRDDGDYDEDVQFLANRGYVVLQPQYRGSSSYGDDFYQKGRGQWGRAMQDDLDDGMDWLAKEGVIDPKRVCIVGSSYGGYAAQWGAIRNPERYRCAVSFAGVSDMPRNLKFQLSDMSNLKRGAAEWKKTVMGPEDFDLKTISPLFFADKLKVPVMLLHGDKDQRVQYKQSTLMVDALKAAGKDYEFYAMPGEGHGFSKSVNARLWYDKLDAFLKKHNPAD